MGEIIQPYHKKFQGFADAQQSYQMWRIGLQIDNEPKRGMVEKMIKEVKELDHEFGNGGDKWTFAGEAVDIFMIGLSTLTTYGIKFDDNFNYNGTSVRSFNEMEALADKEIQMGPGNTWKQQMKNDLHNEVLMFAGGIRNDDVNTVQNSAFKLMLYSTKLITSCGFKLSDIFTGKFNRNEVKYKIDPELSRLAGGLGQAYLALAKERWEAHKKKDVLFLQAEVDNKEQVYEES